MSMSFTFAQTVPYHPSQCPKCKLLVGDNKCKGFVTKDPLGDMLGTFKGESDEPCAKFIPAESPAALSNTDQNEENTNKVKCAKCNKYFDWNEAYNQQDTPGSSAYNPPGTGEFRPRTFCPNCGFLSAEWDINQKGDRNHWKWYGQNKKLNAGKELPPSPIILWGKSIPLEVRVSVSEEQIDLSKMSEGVINSKFFNAAVYGNVATVKEQILAGADINTKSYKGETAIMLAAAEGHTEVVKTLIEAGVDINDQNVFGRHTPLILAALSGHLDTVKVLIDSGANSRLKNQFGKTAEEAAKGSGHSEIANFLKSEVEGSIPEEKKESQAEEQPKKGGCFIATAAFSNDNHPTVVLFRNFRDDVLIQDFFGNFLIRIYYIIGPYLSKFIIKYKLLQKTVKFLLEKIANVILTEENN